VKVVTLLHDLVLEVKETEEAWQSVSQGTSKYAELQEKRRQYRAAGLIPRLVEKGWCTHLPRLLLASPSTTQHVGRMDDLNSALEQDLPVQPVHDVIEKVVAAMLVLADVCVDRFVYLICRPKEKTLGSKSYQNIRLYIKLLIM
jgi:hypothetical protein